MDQIAGALMQAGMSAAMQWLGDLFGGGGPGGGPGGSNSELAQQAVNRMGFRNEVAEAATVQLEEFKANAKAAIGKSIEADGMKVEQNGNTITYTQDLTKKYYPSRCTTEAPGYKNKEDYGHRCYEDEFTDEREKGKCEKNECKASHSDKHCMLWHVRECLACLGCLPSEPIPGPHYGPCACPGEFCGEPSNPLQPCTCTLSGTTDVTTHNDQRKRCAAGKFLDGAPYKCCRAEGWTGVGEGKIVITVAHDEKGRLLSLIKNPDGGKTLVDKVIDKHYDILVSAPYHEYRETEVDTAEVAILYDDTEGGKLNGFNKNEDRRDRVLEPGFDKLLSTPEGEMKQLMLMGFSPAEAEAMAGKVFWVGGHGSPGSIRLDGYSYQFARAGDMDLLYAKLSTQGWKPGTPIMLVSCSTGGATRGGMNMAQAISNKFGVLTVGASKVAYGGAGGFRVPGGSWLRFTPK